METFVAVIRNPINMYSNSDFERFFLRYKSEAFTYLKTIVLKNNIAAGIAL